MEITTFWGNGYETVFKPDRKFQFFKKYQFLGDQTTAKRFVRYKILARECQYKALVRQTWRKNKALLIEELTEYLMQLSHKPVTKSSVYCIGWRYREGKEEVDKVFASM